jgi:hypothetical protein
MFHLLFFFNEQADRGFAAGAIFLGGGERGRFGKKKGFSFYSSTTDFREKRNPLQADSIVRYIVVVFCVFTLDTPYRGPPYTQTDTDR